MEQQAGEKTSDTSSKLRRIIRRELSPEWISFNGVHHKKFATPLVNIPFQPVSWIIIRFFAAIYLVVWLGILLSKWGSPPDYPRGSDSKGKFFLYASNWAYLSTCLYFTFSAISTFIYHMGTAYKDTSTKVNKEQLHITNLIECGEKDPCGKDILPWYFKLTWLLKNLIYTCIILTSFLRWAVDTGEPYQYATSAADVHVHGIALLLIMIDFVMVASPYRLQHVIYPLVIIMAYYMFTLLYFFSGGTNEHHLDKETDGDTYLYREKLDWGRYPRTTAFFFLLVMGGAVPVTHIFIYVLFKIKETVVEWYHFFNKG